MEYDIFKSNCLLVESKNGVCVFRDDEFEMTVQNEDVDYIEINSYYNIINYMNQRFEAKKMKNQMGM